MRGAPRREFEAVKPPRTARSHGSRRLRRLAARDSLSFERATLSRDVARILRILAASGKSEISRTDERRVASFEPRASVALLPAVLVSSGFVESASPFQSARTRPVSRQEQTYWTVLI